MAKYTKKVKLENGKYEYQYQKTYKNVVKGKNGKVYVYYKPRKIKIKKQLKEMVKVAVLFCITTESQEINIHKTSFFGKSATHKEIKNYLRKLVETLGEDSLYRYYRAGWTKMTREDFNINYDQKFPQNITETIQASGSYTMNANEVLLNMEYNNFKEDIKSFVVIHDYKNTFFISKDYRLPSERELKGSKKGIKTMSKKAIVRFSEKQKIEQLKKEIERLRKENEKLKKQKR